MIEFYVVAFENMAPFEAIGPFEDRQTAARAVALLKFVRLRYPFGIATRRPAGIPVMPAAMFVAEFEAAMRLAQSHHKEAP